MNINNNNSGNLCTADFIANILQTPINLKENLKYIQSNTIILEISPDNTLLEVLKGAVDMKKLFVGSLMQRNDNNLSTLFNTIGKYVQCKIIINNIFYSGSFNL